MANSGAIEATQQKPFEDGKSCVGASRLAQASAQIGNLRAPECLQGKHLIGEFRYWEGKKRQHATRPEGDAQRCDQAGGVKHYVAGLWAAEHDAAIAANRLLIAWIIGAD